MSLEDLTSGKDTLKVMGTTMETSHQTFNYTAPTRSYYYITLEREVILADIMKQRLRLMLGFNVTWYYSGMESDVKYSYKTDLPWMEAFVRNCSNNIPK